MYFSLYFIIFSGRDRLGMVVELKVHLLKQIQNIRETTLCIVCILQWLEFQDNHANIEDSQNPSNPT